jgi:hypothetical protein
MYLISDLQKAGCFSVCNVLASNVTYFYRLSQNKWYQRWKFYLRFISSAYHLDMDCTYYNCTFVFKAWNNYDIKGTNSLLSFWS